MMKVERNEAACVRKFPPYAVTQDPGALLPRRIEHNRRGAELTCRQMRLR